MLDDGAVRIDEYLGDAEHLVLPDMLDGQAVTVSGEDAFASCPVLDYAAIPRSVTEIADSTFYGCESLRFAAIPDTVIEIGDSAFWGCTPLTDVSIPGSVNHFPGIFPHRRCA